MLSLKRRHIKPAIDRSSTPFAVFSRGFIHGTATTSTEILSFFLFALAKTEDGKLGVFLLRTWSIIFRLSRDAKEWLNIFRADSNKRVSRLYGLRMLHLFETCSLVVYTVRFIFVPCETSFR